MTPEQEILEDALIALRQRKARFIDELSDHADVFPLPADAPVDETKHLSFHVAAFSKRYEMTQDQVVRRLFRSVAAAKGVTLRTKALGELITMMHRLGIVEDIDRWHEITKVRNALAHDYLLTVTQLTACINKAWHFAPDLIAMIDRVDSYVTDNHLLTDEAHD